MVLVFYYHREHVALNTFRGGGAFGSMLLVTLLYTMPMEAASLSLVAISRLSMSLLLAAL
jgi:hypothetical protein